MDDLKRMEFEQDIKDCFAESYNHSNGSYFDVLINPGGLKKVLLDILNLIDNDGSN